MAAFLQPGRRRVQGARPKSDADGALGVLDEPRTPCFGPDARLPRISKAGLEPVKRGVTHGTLDVPDPATFAIPPMTAAALGDAADEVAIRAWHSLATPASPPPPPGTC